jgi:PAS domain S-box-containing protein
MQKKPGTRDKAVTPAEQHRRADEQLRAIVNSSPIPTLVSRMEDGAIIFVNEPLAKLIGLSVRDLAGRSSADFYYRPEERAPLVERIRRDRLLRNFEIQLRRADGTPIWTLISIVATELAGETVLVSGFADISDRKSAEEALQRERNFVSAVVDTEGALVVVLDTSGRIVRFNRACEQITGYRFEEINSRPFWEIFLLPEETERIRGVFNELCAGSFPNSAENYWRIKDGGLRLIAWRNTAMLDKTGRVEHIISTGIDVTEQR